MRIFARWIADYAGRIAAILLLIVGPISSGCSAWKETVTEPFELPSARMSPDSVAIEMTFVRVPVGQAEVNELLWQQVDEQVVSVASRLHMNNNGFRCGLVGVQIPDVLRELLGRQDETARLDQAVTSALDVLAQNQLVQRRSGQRWEIVTGAPRPQMIVLYKEVEQAKVSGKSFADAQCVMAGRPYPQGDGSVRIELTPEIHHGPPRKQWVAGEGTFQLVAGREREVYQQLLIDVPIRPGQTLVIGCTPDLKGLGHNFFVEEGRGDAQQKLLLIRLAQVQRNELFEAPDSL